MRIPLGLRAASGRSTEGWDLANARYGGTPLNFFYLGEQDAQPYGLFFGNNGTKMYMIGRQNDRVYEYDLTTAWDVSTASYVQFDSIGAYEAGPTAVHFSSDGTKMYVIGSSGDDVNEFDLSSAWDISTATFSQNFSVSAQEANPQGLFFKPDGTQMYILGGSGDDVNEYDLTTPWDVSTASYVQNFSVATEDTSPTDIYFKPDGTKMYITGDVSDSVYEYDLSSGWDVSTASYVQSYNVRTDLPSAMEEVFPNGIFLSSDGTQMYITGYQEDKIFQYDLSTPWDLSSASFNFPTSDYFNIGAYTINPHGIFLKPDGTKMYIMDFNSDQVEEYNLSTPWNLSSASFVQHIYIGGTTASPTDVFFKDDGTKMYVMDNNSDRVHEFNLSSAWDVSTATASTSVYIGFEESVPYALFIGNSGTKLYVVGSSQDTVWEYDLTTPWDVSSAVYSNGISVAAQASLPEGLSFKDDGTKMFVLNSSDRNVYEYDLSTEWDVSTASYSGQSFSVIQFEQTPRGLFFKSDDGKKMYIVGSDDDNAWSFDL